jgi:hypothetical protein
MTQRHARKLRSIYGHIPSDEELRAGWHDGGAAASASATSAQAPSRPAVPPEPPPSMPEETMPEQVVPETAVAEQVAAVGAAGDPPGDGIGAGGRGTASESVPEESVVAAAPVRRAQARTCRNWFRERLGHLWVRGEDDAVRPGGQRLNSRARSEPSAVDFPAGWKSRFARGPPMR